MCTAFAFSKPVLYIGEQLITNAEGRSSQTAEELTIEENIDYSQCPKGEGGRGRAEQVDRSGSGGRGE